MTEPAYLPDDAGTSIRGIRTAYHRRVRVLNEEAERRVQAVRDEHAALVGECQQLAARLGAALATAEALREELRLARAAVLNQCGDNLCWLTDPGAAKALPEAEFLESCRRYRDQIAGERGEFAGGMTIAQLEGALAVAEKWHFFDDGRYECTRLANVAARRALVKAVGGTGGPA